MSNSNATSSKETTRSKYASVAGMGSPYRTISAHLHGLGIVLNHASSRNHVIRTTSKFVRAYMIANGMVEEATDTKVRSIASSPLAQQAIGELINMITT
jgi:hypothetical protein